MTRPGDADDRADELFRRLAGEESPMSLPPPEGTWQQIRGEARRRRHRRQALLLGAAASVLVVLTGAVVTVALRPDGRTQRLVQAGPPSATPAPSRPASPHPTPTATAPPVLTVPSTSAGPGASPLPAPVPTARSAPPTTASTQPSAQPSTQPSAQPSTPPSTPPAAPLRACVTSQLTLGAGQVQAMASTRSVVLDLTNTSTLRCTVTGYGDLRLVDGHGSPLPTTQHRSPVPAARAIVLAPNGFTTRTVSWRVVPDPPTTAADCTSGAALQVTPPDESRSLLLHEAITACDHGTLEAGAWTRNAG